jgi:carboxymethylenebutenolidase
MQRSDAGYAMTRREFVVTSLAVGFAAAVSPVVAETLVATDAQGLDVGEVKIPVADGEVPACRAMPTRGAPFPIVVVVQEIFGVHEYIKDVCRRFASRLSGGCARTLRARAT